MARMAPRDCLNQIFQGHTAYAGLDVQVVGIDRLHHVASLLCLLSHDAEHLRYQAFLPWASIYNQYIHRYNIC